MDSKMPRKIRLDPEDLIPSTFRKLDPKKWVEAPEFVPSSHKQSGNSNEFNKFLYDLNQHPPQEFMPVKPQQMVHNFIPACFAVPSALIPQGYSANFTTINDYSGTLFPTIILKKRRKRRHRRPTSNNIGTVVRSNNNIRLKSSLSCHSEPEICSKLEMDQACLMNKGELNGNTSGSCPDLSDDQLKLWDEILFKAVQNEHDALDHKTNFLTKNRRRTTNESMTTSMITNGKRARSNTPMQTSIYEICAMEPRDEENCCDFNGNVSKSPVCGDNSQTSSSHETDSSDSALEIKSHQTDTQKLAQKLRKELEDLHFRTSYEWQRSDGKVISINTNPLFDAVNDYPQQQEDFQPTHMANYNPKLGAFASTSLVNAQPIQTKQRSFEADYFENMNIRVNPFEESNDIVLDEYDCPQPSRFQQLQWAIQRQKERYNDQLQIPQRVCCSIM